MRLPPSISRSAPSSAPILVADSDERFRLTVCQSLRDHGRSTEEAGCPKATLSLADECQARVAVIGEFGDGGQAALQIVQRLRSASNAVSVVFIPRQGSEELAIAALRTGVSDYLRRPLSVAALTACIDRCAGNNCKAVAQTAGPVEPVDGDGDFVCASGPMLALKRFLVKVSKTDSNLLITGETGTGKELVARYLHQLSARAHKPLVYVNCAALPDTLLESELFGYERGAFTGAVRSYPGRFRQAAGGTIVLDEIGEMTTHAQAKLLRAIESRQISPLGGHQTLPLDARIVAATNQDPEALIRERQFRSDLYFRLNVARIHIAPLRERTEDVVPLFEHFVAEFNQRRGTEVTGLSPSAARCLLQYDWPGNVRELRNTVETMFIDPPDGEISLCHLPQHLYRETPARAAELSERDRLLAALTATGWNKSEAAKQLQWSRMTLYRKLTKYDVGQELAS